MTTAQARVYDALVDLTADGWPASAREIAEYAGYSSPSSVHPHLRWLEREGYVRPHPNPARRSGWLLGKRRLQSLPPPTLRDLLGDG